MSASKPENDTDAVDPDTSLRPTRDDPRNRSTRYPVTAAPPSSDGADHDTDTLLSSALTPTPRGADGTVACCGAGAAVGAGVGCVVEQRDTQRIAMASTPMLLDP
ncbi:MAG: hypothetical protein OXG34_10260 [bacterium]|nr:hypothetical protein [bacterium]